MTLRGALAKMGGGVERGREHSSGNSHTIGIEQTGPLPLFRQALGQGPQVNPLEVLADDSVEINIGEHEVHSQARVAANAIAVTLEHFCECRNVFRGFKRVVIVGTISQGEAGAAQVMQAFPIAHTDPAPIVALKQNQRSIEGEVFSRRGNSWALQ
jgi:hypothetical protein